MRTTVTLDNDLAERLRQLAHRSRLPFKRVLNEALRRGLPGGTAEGEEPPFVVKAGSMKLKTGLDPMRLARMETDLDVEEFKSRRGRGRRSGR